MRLLRSRNSESDVIQPEERLILRKCISENDVVFDIGANHGDWTKAVLAGNAVELHAFEASPKAYDRLKNEIGDAANVNHYAVTHSIGEIVFHVYRDDERLSSIYRRKSVEKELLPSGSDAIRVPAISLDDYWPEDKGLIHFLKIDVEGAEYDVLRGCRQLLRRGAINCIQFEYGGTYFDAGITLGSVFSYLRRFGYHVFQIKGSRFKEIKKFRKQIENYQYNNLLAVHQRLYSRFIGSTNVLDVYFNKLEDYGIPKRGVIHVGAHIGQEVAAYRDLGIEKIVLIEANPKLAEGLRNKYSDTKDVSVVECAISNRSGTAKFNVASMDQSSSLLELQDHASLYPKIVYEEQIDVEVLALDECLEKNRLCAADYNLLMMDIQGAELLALEGAMKTLKHIDAIQLEVNYAELYRGNPTIWDIDRFLEEQGFVRTFTQTPHHPMWGDALYIRKPTVTNQSLGSMGRFANQIFQYLFLRTYAEEQNCNFANPPWDGDKLFHIQPGTTDLPPQPNEVQQGSECQADCEIANRTEPLINTDVCGYFQYNMQHYAPYRSLIEKELSFRPEYAKKLAAIKQIFDQQPGICVGLHLRRSDYGTGVFFIAPSKWYRAWLKDLSRKHGDVTVYVASDDLAAVRDDFLNFRVLTGEDVSDEQDELPFFTDFAALTICDKLAISNSTFSFAASLINRHADEFVRPSLADKRLIRYDPWSSAPLLRGEKAEEGGEEFMSEHAKSRSQYKLRKLFRIFG